LMEEALDTGPVASQLRMPIGEANAAEIRRRLAEAGAEALFAVLARLESGGVSWTAQVDDEATYAAKISASDLALDPTLSPAVLVRRVRASGESAASRAMIAGRLVAVEEATVAEVSPGAGLVGVSSSGLVLGCMDGAIVVTRLTPAGKRGMSGLEFARGARLVDGAVWSVPE
jgi:methionyl-tRNA formyltransferase